MSVQNELIHSTIFGTVMQATPAQREVIDKLVADFPVDVFQSLNRSLNTNELVLTISSMLAD